MLLYLLQHLDRFSGLGKRRHLFFSLMRIFWKEYTIMSLMTMVQAGADLSVPVGVNQLLRWELYFDSLWKVLIALRSYIERKGADTTIQPWVWIIWLLLGPTLSSIAFEWYIFVSVGNNFLHMKWYRR